MPPRNYPRPNLGALRFAEEPEKQPGTLDYLLKGLEGQIGLAQERRTAKDRLQQQFKKEKELQSLRFAEQKKWETEQRNMPMTPTEIENLKLVTKIGERAKTEASILSKQMTRTNQEYEAYIFDLQIEDPTHPDVMEYYNKGMPDLTNEQILAVITSNTPFELQMSSGRLQPDEEGMVTLPDKTKASLSALNELLYLVNNSTDPVEELMGPGVTVRDKYLLRVIKGPTWWTDVAKRNLAKVMQDKETAQVAYWDSKTKTEEVIRQRNKIEVQKAFGEFAVWMQDNLPKDVLARFRSKKFRDLWMPATGQSPDSEIRSATNREGVINALLKARYQNLAGKPDEEQAKALKEELRELANFKENRLAQIALEQYGDPRIFQTVVRLQDAIDASTNEDGTKRIDQFGNSISLAKAAVLALGTGPSNVQEEFETYLKTGQFPPMVGYSPLENMQKIEAFMDGFVDQIAAVSPELAAAVSEQFLKQFGRTPPTSIPTPPVAEEASGIPDQPWSTQQPSRPLPSVPRPSPRDRKPDWTTSLPISSRDPEFLRSALRTPEQRAAAVPSPTYEDPYTGWDPKLSNKENEQILIKALLDWGVKNIPTGEEAWEAITSALRKGVSSEAMEGTPGIGPILKFLKVFEARRLIKEEKKRKQEMTKRAKERSPF